MYKKTVENNLPNIIYILADDLGYGDLSCLNENSKITTPNLDKMARQGITFTDAHSSSAVCTPSRYSILTGRYNWRSRLKHGVLGGYSTHLIEDDRLTVASMLKEVNYKTACVGKWHLGCDWGRISEDIKIPDKPNYYGVMEGIDYSKPIENGPTEFGFDYFFGISGSLDIPPYVYIENDKVVETPNHITEGAGKGYWRKGVTAKNFKHEEVLPNFTKKVLEIIDEWSNEPFFIYYPLSAPHMPFLPTKEFVGKSKINSYLDFVLMCDDVVGQILNKLDENKIAKNTIVIFTSDNGAPPAADFESLARFGHCPSYIFRGHKADIYEGGHRIPLLINWPDRIKANSISDEPVCLTDLMATIAEIAGYDLPENAGEDSVSNLPIWISEDYSKPLREAIIHHSYDGSFSIRKGKWKLEMCPGTGGFSDLKHEEALNGFPKIQLYDLEYDISEKKNVYDKYPGVVHELKELLEKYIKEGRSTPGKAQENTGSKYWEQLHWME